MVDVRELTTLSKYAAMTPMLAQCWPADRSLSTFAPLSSISGGGEKPSTGWPVNQCCYCYYRGQAPAGQADSWWYGTGDGAHEGVFCRRLKRFVAEGGDASKTPHHSATLSQNGLRFGKNYTEQHKPTNS